MTTPDNKQKRAGKRYPYPRPAQCDAESQILEIQILNISASGIQFAVRIKIESKKPIRVQWKDSQFGNFDVSIVIAREVHKPENKEFQYYYGSQYYNLSTDAKERLVNLLKHFKTEEKKINQLQVEQSTPEHIFEVIEQGTPYLRRVFNSNEPDPYFENILKQVVDYEKTSFMLEDEISLSIQKLVTHHFHCNLLGILASQVAEREEFKGRYFEAAKVELDKIAHIENEIEALSMNIPQEGLNGEEKSNIQRRLNESSNRLFYTKQSLLQSVVETFSADAENPNFKDTYEKIRSEYEKILEFASSGGGAETLTYKRRSRDITDDKIKDVIDVPIMSDKKPSSTLWLGSIFVFVVLCVFGVLKGIQLKDKSSFKDKIGIGIPIKSFKKFDTQIEITISAEDWNKLPVPEREKVLANVVAYLKQDRAAKSCIMFDDHLNIIRIMYEEVLPGNLKINPAAPASPAPPAESAQPTDPAAPQNPVSTDPAASEAAPTQQPTSEAPAETPVNPEPTSEEKAPAPEAPK